MWLGQVKFFCTSCGEEMTGAIRKMIEWRCKELSIDPMDLGEKAHQAANVRMLQELDEKGLDPGELSFVNATALLIMELVFSPSLLCSRCRSTSLNEDVGRKVELRLVKGGKSEQRTSA